MGKLTSGSRILVLAAAIAGITALVAIAALLHGPGANTTAEANHGATPGLVDLVAIDADTGGNGAHALGTIQDCLAVSSGGPIDVDIVADEVAPANGVGGIDILFNYNPALIHVLSISDTGSSVMMGADGSAVLSFSSTVGDDSPFDADSIPEGADGSIKVAAADFGSTTGNSGAGLLARLSLQVVGSGLSDLTLTDTTLVDAANNPLPVVSVAGTKIATDVACPGLTPKADIAVSNVIVTSPASSTSGAPVTVTADALISNLGPDGPALVDVSTTISVPSDCTFPEPPTVVSTDVSIATGPGTRIPAPAAQWHVTCASPSDHIFSATAVASTDPAESIDNVQSNNQASGQANTALLAQADGKITSFVLTAPAQSIAGKPFDVTGNAVIHNNGPLSPARISAEFHLTVPADCAISVVGFAEGGIFDVPSSTAFGLNSTNIHWRVRCDTPGVHNFSATGAALVAQAHVTDPTGGNNAAAAGTGTTTKIGACQADPNPAGNPFQNLGPLLLTTLAALTATGTPIPEDQQVPLNCVFDMKFDDNNGGPVDDCEASTIENIGCTISIDVSVDEAPGTLPSKPGATLNPIAVTFLPAAIDMAADTAIPNGSVAGSGSFKIRSDAGLNPNGGECVTDVFFVPTVGVEGGITPNVPDSNLNDALMDPNLWPNDLNAERALVESSFDINPLPLLPPEVTLWSRTVIPLGIEGVLDLPLNVMVWRIDDLALQGITQARWIIVAFPGDAVGPDPAGPSGGNPDADDEVGGSVLQYCTPYHQNLTLFGTAGGLVRNKCIIPGSNMGWAVMDPNAVDFTGDDSTRSNVSPCSADADNDGLTSEEETYYGTNALNADTDGDGFQDGADNCPAQANANQVNYDGDRQGDICDPDVDGDGAANGADLCPNTVVGADADANGCSQAQVDADRDAVCNPGAPSGGPSPSCSGSDVCPSTVLGQTADANGCSQPQVDSDADGACNAGAPSGGPPPGCTGTDNCPGLANPDQSDVDGDAYGDACDGCPGVATTWAVPANDDDCDGFPSADELLIGTIANIRCSATAAVHDENPQPWPADFDDNRSINITDVLSMKPDFGGTVGINASARTDLVPDNSINISDVLKLKPFFGKTCS